MRAWPPWLSRLSVSVFSSTAANCSCREGQEDQLAALGFALNVLVLWNTQYMDDAVGHLRRGGREISHEHLARLSPLQHEHILMLGTFPFTLPHELADGQRRRLRIDDRSA